MNPKPGVPVAIALGCNLGDREAHIAEAVRRLGDLGVRVGRVSSLYETAPVGWADGGPGVPWFLNAVCLGASSSSPHALLGRLRELEVALGRRPDPGLRPRAIDLDLIFYGQRVVRSRTLVLPHPRFRERAFVLVPLKEVAPDWVDPVTGRTVSELARLLGDGGEGVRLYEREG